ncbi:hypothetical protein MUP79_07700 [Candidatus Bathyarchaeota archaeon]|nr:hypothetical protein [Candidatus Bathyarchaeota archaeon]
MARKIVRVYISPEQKRLLERVCQTLGYMKARFSVTRFSSTQTIWDS